LRWSCRRGQGHVLRLRRLKPRVVDEVVHVVVIVAAAAAIVELFAAVPAHGLPLSLAASAPARVLRRCCRPFRSDTTAATASTYLRGRGRLRLPAAAGTAAAAPTAS
ncbi:unnamed protein product, partial [Ectocarpus sp. 4 AP-2014]